MEVKKKLLKDIIQYCEFNNIEDIDEEINKYIQIGFNIVRFGVEPFKEYEEKKPKKTSIKKQDKIEKIETEIIENQPIIEEDSKVEEVKPKRKIRVIKSK